MKNYRVVFYSFFLPFLLSCNIYAPLTANSSNEDKLEEGQKCLHDTDYACAIKNYEEISDTALRNEKLCMTYLSQSGFTLTTLINVVNAGGTTMLGKLAEALVPYTNEKFNAAVKAKETCLAYATSPLSPDLGELLKTMAYLDDCAIRIAKTDVFVSTSDGDTACNTAGAGNGKINKTDIGPSGGVLSAASPGMCKADVDFCLDDIVQISGSKLGNFGFGDLKSAYDSLPAALKTSGQATVAVRAGLRDAVAN